MQSKLAEHYGDGFYERQATTSLQSARIYLAHLWRIFQPGSVLDVGCGRGTWLKACHELGSETLYGFDGEWNRQALMIDSAVRFRSIDLNQPFALSEKVDLAMTLEVAEHLNEASAPEFIRCLTSTADAVLFSAAYTKQGGTNHINEQPHTFWAKLFAEHDFAVFDVFRPVFWGNDTVSFWYRQNTFLYARRGSKPYDQLCGQGFVELKDISFMNCIHPELYKRKVLEPPPLDFKSHVVDLVPSVLRALRRRASKLRGR
jgi:SAM-dependent methyltransferase